MRREPNKSLDQTMRADTVPALEQTNGKFTIPQNKTAAESVGPPCVRFFGRPGDRSVASKPSDFAVARTQVSLPYGLPRSALSPRRSSSQPPYGSSQTPRTPVNRRSHYLGKMPACPSRSASCATAWRWDLDPPCKTCAQPQPTPRNAVGNQVTQITRRSVNGGRLPDTAPATRGQPRAETAARKPA
jgi:hypothetical protein